jgi:hypothetical protein
MLLAVGEQGKLAVRSPTVREVKLGCGSRTAAQASSLAFSGIRSLWMASEHACAPVSRRRFATHSAATFALNLISLGTLGSFTTSTGALHLSVLMRQVPVLSSRQ